MKDAIKMDKQELQLYTPPTYCVNCKHCVIVKGFQELNYKCAQSIEFPKQEYNPVTGEPYNSYMKLCHHVNKDANCKMYEQKDPKPWWKFW